MAKQASSVTPEEKRMLRKMFNRSWVLFFGFNMINYLGFGYSQAMMPAIKSFYKEGSEESKQAMTRATQFFNCTYETAPFIMGLNAAMEKENAQTEGFETESINATKAALMGPLSAIGDSVFWGVVRTIAASIAIPLAATGSIFGPLLFLLVYHLPSILVRYNLLTLGYTAGSKFLQKASSSGLLKAITYCISIVGMIMVGSMAAQFVTVSTAFTFTFSSGETLVLQDILDSIIKGFLPLGFTFGFFALLRKKVKITWITLGVLVLGLVLALIGFV